MLNADGFNGWAKDYDSSVSNCEAEKSYPFAGYTEVLSKIEGTVFSKRCPSVLDLGFGTAELTEQLYRGGCGITGVDFSRGMIDRAKEKMPQATLLQADFASGLPEELSRKSFDFIIGTYSIHHVLRRKQAEFLGSLSDRLTDGGKILIGDIMFQNQKEYDSCHTKYAVVWDEDEVYPVAEQWLPALAKLGLSAKFQKISFCAGILTIQK